MTANVLRLPLLLSCAALAGCAAPRPSAHWPAAGLYAERGAMAAPVPVASAIATLPPTAGRIVQVTEQRFADGLSQQIVLMGDATTRGENRIDVAIRTQPENDQVQDNTIRMQRPSEAQIARELEARFPDVAMESVPVLVQNACLMTFLAEQAMIVPPRRGCSPFLAARVGS